MTVATKKQIDVNDQAFEKSLEAYRENAGSYGVFTQDELETMRQFFDLNTEAQSLGVQADSIRAEITSIENQIQDARRLHNSLISEGYTAKAMEAIEQIPSLRKKQDHLLAKLPSIGERLDAIEKTVGSIDHSKFLTLAKQAADDAEKSRCRAVSIFSKPSDVRRSIAEAKKKIG